MRAPTARDYTIAIAAVALAADYDLIKRNAPTISSWIGGWFNGKPHQRIIAWGTVAYLLAHFNGKPKRLGAIDPLHRAASLLRG